uniref:Peptidase S9 prolyl oligopeptidase catalytic domain-containing protein n=1 Tax=Hemiselmis andersenii TaxID=464988 RepID=A0A6T8GYY9_HEMAN|mmetsp:Transcript_25952/g.62951  ORF Transcript_25952/g.62951 Transcript_25952/m.62951 type:complete len:254 (-) Transcript_25952:65-826(-)
MGQVVARLAFLPPAPSYEKTWSELEWATTKRGERIPLLYVPCEGAKYTVLFSHANAEDLGHVAEHLKLLSNVLQVNVLGYDYTGYGCASGVPSEADCYSDLAAAFEFLMVKKQQLPQNVVLYGRSIGSGPTCEMASRTQVGGVIVQSAFTSCIRVAYDVRHTAFDAFCNLDKVSKIKCPVLVIHGTKDDVVPLGHGKALFKMCKRPHRPFWVGGAGHNDIEVSHFPALCQRVQEFVWGLDPEWSIVPGTTFCL